MKHISQHVGHILVVVIALIFLLVFLFYLNSDESIFLSLGTTLQSNHARELNNTFIKVQAKQIHIISWLSSAWSNEGYEIMRTNRKRYASKHGYEFLDYDENTVPVANANELRYKIKISI